MDEMRGQVRAADGVCGLIWFARKQPTLCAGRRVRGQLLLKASGTGARVWRVPAAGRRGRQAFGALAAAGAGRRVRGQSSLEALLAFAVLLCALAVLAHAARGQSDAFASAVDKADARVSLAREALYADLSAGLLPGASLAHNLSGVPVAGGEWLASSASGSVREPLFHRISVGGEGKYYVQTEEGEDG